MDTKFERSLRDLLRADAFSAGLREVLTEKAAPPAPASAPLPASAFVWRMTIERGPDGLATGATIVPIRRAEV